MPVHGDAFAEGQRTRWDLIDLPEPRVVRREGRTCYGVAKVAGDFCCALALLVLTAPLTLLAALAIKLTSRGPVLYSQTRLGRGGRPYKIYKLRTMYHNCEQQSGARWSTDGDPRVTPVGRFLRRTHIDELPQLWNVLRGDMSLVGPRPEQIDFVVRLEASVPFYQRRHLIRPGLTGWAQVRCGYAGSDESSAWKLCNDLYYVKYRSLGLDLLVLIETVGLVLLGPSTASRIPLTPWAEPDPIADAATRVIP